MLAIMFPENLIYSLHIEFKSHQNHWFRWLSHQKVVYQMALTKRIRLKSFESAKRL